MQEYEQVKKDKKVASAYLKKENVIRIAHNINYIALKMFVNSKNKTGFITLAKSNSDLFNYYLKPFYNACHLFLNKSSDDDDIDVCTCDKTDYNTLQDFQTWALNKLQENKQKQAEQKNKLASIKTGVQFAKMDKKTLQAVILQARQALATIKE